MTGLTSTSRPQGDRVALVTGAGRGIGRAIAVRLAADGVRVMAVARTADELSELAAETGGEWFADTVATAEGCERIVEETERRYGRIDVLVNNAGIGSAGEQLTWLQDPARWHEAMAVNLHAPFELARLTLPGMIDRGFGRIVMIASLASLAAGVAPGMSALCHVEARPARPDPCGSARSRGARRHVQRGPAGVGADEDVGTQGCRGGGTVGHHGGGGMAGTGGPYVWRDGLSGRRRSRPSSRSSRARKRAP